MSRLIAMDTETTGLDPRTERVWEIAMIDIDTQAEQVYTIQPPQQVVDDMHPKAAEVNRYHERTSAEDWNWDIGDGISWGAFKGVFEDLYNWLHEAHVLGAVPDFDTRFLDSMFRLYEMPIPRWHYHLIDIETMAFGWLHGRSAQAEAEWKAENELITATRPKITLPWDSDELSAACGIHPPDGAHRHTALGDARWVASWWYRLTGVA